MFVGIVGSRNLGECACSSQSKSWPPTPDEKAHTEECPKAVAWMLMLRVIGRWAVKDDVEGFVSGGAPGADSLARDAAGMFDFTIENKRFIEYKPKGGPEPFRVRAYRRNQQIVDKAGALVAIYAPGPRSPGTSDTVRRALEKGIPVWVWHRGRWTNT